MKRQCDSEEEENDTEIFSYNNKKTLTFKHDLVELLSSDSESSSDSADESESDEEKIENNDSPCINTVVQKPAKKRIMLSPPSPPPPPTATNYIQPKKVKTIHLLSQLQEDKEFSPLNTSTKSLLTDDEDMKKQHVKVRLHGLIKKFEVKPDERFEKVLEEIAILESVKASNVVLTFKNRNVLPSDTILKLNISVADILECFTLTDTSDFTETNDTISIVLQSSGRNKSKFTAIKYVKLEDLLDKYCLQNGLDKHTVSLSVDGDKLDCSKTPLELEIFDEDVIDVHIAE